MNVDIINTFSKCFAQYRNKKFEICFVLDVITAIGLFFVLVLLQIKAAWQTIKLDIIFSVSKTASWKELEY